jgi:hypothetical protein
MVLGQVLHSQQFYAGIVAHYTGNKMGMAVMKNAT